jgi:outer membrane protein assembly factor BamB
MVTNDIRRTGYKLTITKPDGTSETRNWNVVEDTTNVQSISYTPTMAGTYTLKFDYAGQTYTWSGTYQNDTYLPASATTTLTVQTDPIAPVVVYPLPTEYWTRPIEGQNLAWSQLGSHWLRGAQFGTFQMSTNYNLWQKSGTGPTTAHILWTKPIEFGGVVGGESMIPDLTHYSGGSYEGRFQNTMIMHGRIYVQLPLGHSGNGGGYACYDLRTGEQLWYRDDLNAYFGTSLRAAPSFGQLFDFESPNQHGVGGGVLWQTSSASGVTTWQAFDGFTGKWMYNLTSVPSGTDVYTTQGEIVRYVLSYNTTTKTGLLQLWNSTTALLSIGTGYNINSWRPVGNVINASAGAYSWNATISADLTGSSAPAIFAILPGDIILGRSSNLAPGVGARFTDNPFTMWAISDKPGSKGQLIWKKDYAAPENGNLTLRLASVDPTNRVWTMNDVEYMQWRGYSLDTGEPLWGPTTVQFRALQFFGSGEGGGQRGVTAYGNIYVQGFGGEVFCFSAKTGNLVWKFNDTNSGLETAWGLRPIFISAVADGKVYAFNNEHSPNSPLYRGNKVYCLNATTGEEIWSLLGWSGQTGGQGGSTAVLADGILAYYSYYDNSIYAIGKGSSAISVEASPEVTVEGSSVLIKGTVIDTSAGTTLSEEAKRFPDGVPAVSDESMTAWMEYVYMQKPKPTDATGVEVVLSVIDANNNCREIGTATSDTNGFYSLQWTPDIPGKYTVIATFAGSDSYWRSSAETAFAIDTAVPTESPEYPQPVDNTMTIVGLGVAILAAIAIVGVVIAMMLKKK